MKVRNLFLRNGKGKLAGATVYQSNGQTLMREIVSPANPKTKAQMIQRIIMHTVMSSYAKMKEITDHSFEGKKAGADTMAFFMKENLLRLRSRVARGQEQGLSLWDMYNFAPLGMSGYTPNEYLVSMGSLPRVDTTFDENDAAGYCHILALPTSGGQTYQDVCDALGLQRGDQLTFLIIKKVGNGDEYGSNEFVFCRVILDPTLVDGTPAPMSTPFISGTSINCPSARNENTELFAFKFNVDENFPASETFVYGLTGFPGGLTVMQAGIIVSRELSGNWLRSTCYLQKSGDGGLTTYSLMDCLDMSDGVRDGIFTPNSRFLNNAGRSSSGSDVQSGALILPISDPTRTNAAAGNPTANLVSITMENLPDNSPNHNVTPYLIAIDDHGKRYIVVMANQASDKYGRVFGNYNIYGQIETVSRIPEGWEGPYDEEGDNPYPEYSNNIVMVGYTPQIEGASTYQETALWFLNRGVAPEVFGIEQ